MAMWIDSNVTVKAQRIIIKYLNGFFFGKLIVPEAHMTKLGGGHVELSGGNVNVDNESIKYWTKSATKCLEASVQTRLLEKEDESHYNISSIDIVMGGDHGQQKFCVVMKVIVRDMDHNRIDSWVLKIGHIDCKKDTYTVLKNTVADFLNSEARKFISQTNIPVVAKLWICRSDNKIIISTPGEHHLIE